jgi:3,4-dihydroxy 2-butanone 4-phosphate synthase/GTP cyclohydrolase II
MRAFVRNATKSGCGVGKHHFVPMRQQVRRNEASASVSVSGTRSGRRSERTFRCRASVTEPEPPQNGVQGEELTFQEQVELLDKQSDNLDRPSPGFDSVQDAIHDIAAGKFVVVLDDEDRENEGDLIIAAEKMTSSDVAFMVNHTSGLICVGMEARDLDRLNLPQMVDQKKSTDAMGTAFTVSVDLKKGTSTGISASDRCATLQALASPGSEADDFRRPGHIFPLRSREGGVLKRAGHTEAAVDLSRLAGCFPAGVLCEIVNEDGSMARGGQLLEFAKKHGLKTISIADLIRHRRFYESVVERVGDPVRLPTKYGVFQAYCYKSKIDDIEHIALVYGDVQNTEEVLVRVHSECLTGDIMGSLRCDCGPQLELAMKKVVQEGCGVVIYLRGQEGRGIGLGHKLKAYNLQDAGRDTVEANVDLGLPIDSREYGMGAHMLIDVGVSTLKLMTNNPAKYTGLSGYGLKISKRVPLLTPINKENEKYIMTKVNKMGHWFGGDSPISPDVGP